MGVYLGLIFPPLFKGGLKTPAPDGSMVQHNIHREEAPANPALMQQALKLTEPPELR